MAIDNRNIVNKKLDSNTVAEFDRYFSPKTYLVDSLPDPKIVRDFSEVYMKNSQGTYDVYRMVEGSWVLIHSDLATAEQVTTLQKTGGSATTPGLGTPGFASQFHEYYEISADYSMIDKASLNEYKIISIKNIGSTKVTVTPSGSETIDGETTQDLNPYDCMTILSNNSNWIIV